MTHHPFRNATIWQNNSAKIFGNWVIGNNLFGNRTFGNLYSAKVNNEINYVRQNTLWKQTFSQPHVLSKKAPTENWLENWP